MEKIKIDITFNVMQDNIIYNTLRDWCRLVEKPKNKIRLEKLERILNDKVDK